MRSGSSATLDPTSQQYVDRAPSLPFMQVWAARKAHAGPLYRLWTRPGRSALPKQDHQRPFSAAC